MNRKSFFRSIGYISLALVLAVAGCHFLGAPFAILLAVMGLFMAFQGNKGIAIAIMVFMTLLVSMSPKLISKEGLNGIVCRGAPLIIGLALAVQPARQFKDTLPVEPLFLYLVIAAFSSLNGWAPLISYAKLLNFVIFLVGIVWGVKALRGDLRNLRFIRLFFLSLCATIVAASLVATQFPNIGYSNSLGLYDAETAEFLLERSKERGSLVFFSGIFNHSQGFGILLPAIVAYIICDMLFVEQRMSVFHVCIILLSFVELYMTRARVGFVGVSVALFMIIKRPLEALNIRSTIHNKIKNTSYFILFLVIIAGAYFEWKDERISRWIYKMDNVEAIKEADTVNAITATRMGLFDYNMQDFRENRLLGKGYQVSRGMKEKYGNRLVLTAPIEKGILPIMILGETGIVGALAFIIFLTSFYSTAIRRKLSVTVILFTIFLATNIAEANFFSSGGMGGVLWFFFAIAGYSLDLYIQGMAMPQPVLPRVSRRSW